jgi:hypothetical protein
MWPAQISIDLALWVIGFLLLRQWFGKDDCQPLDEFQTQRRHKADPA